jgi:hypothetical protein
MPLTGSEVDWFFYGVLDGQLACTGAFVAAIHDKPWPYFPDLNAIRRSNLHWSAFPLLSAGTTRCFKDWRSNAV